MHVSVYIETSHFIFFTSSSVVTGVDICTGAIETVT
ncbi:hypothetical protein J2780_001779 [Chryseobacterium camelliae]|nr:hypothetical protein [Chryseobacterium camelliae]